MDFPWFSSKSPGSILGISQNEPQRSGATWVGRSSAKVPAHPLRSSLQRRKQVLLLVICLLDTPLLWMWLVACLAVNARPTMIQHAWCLAHAADKLMALPFQDWEPESAESILQNPRIALGNWSIVDCGALFFTFRQEFKSEVSLNPWGHGAHEEVWGTDWTIVGIPSQWTTISPMMIRSLLHIALSCRTWIRRGQCYHGSPSGCPKWALADKVKKDQCRWSGRSR